jgi:hypothetical protein
MSVSDSRGGNDREAASGRGWPDSAASLIRELWRRHGGAVLLVAVLAMIAAAAWRLTNELPSLLFAADGAHDLRLRHWEVPRWFEGHPIYGDQERGDYPPASYVILWPLLGWLGLAPARWLWALTGLGALGWLAWAGVRASGASSRPQILVLALLPFSVYASSATFAIGQLVNHTLPVLLAGLLHLHRSEGRWRDDLLACTLLLASLVKPPLSAPFFWLVCFVPGRWRPIVLVSLGYVALTLLAVSFRDDPLLVSLFGWLGETPQAHNGHTNVHKFLVLAGLRSWMLPASIAIISALGVWVYRQRRADYWLLLGVCAIVAQFWIHHRLYDHLLVVIPMISLFRLARSPANTSHVDVIAGMLFALTWLTLHAPASMLGQPTTLSRLLEGGQAVVWLTVLVFLMRQVQATTSGTRSAQVTAIAT